MARTVISYSQWYVEATAKVAREAFTRMCREAHLQMGVRLYLYYKPKGLEFRAIADGEDATGYELATGEAFSTGKTLEQLTYWVRRMTGNVPVLPGD